MLLSAARDDEGETPAPCFGFLSFPDAGNEAQRSGIEHKKLRSATTP